MSECPSPFVIDPLAAHNSTLDTRFCRLGCCIPCPSQNFFYPEGYLEKGFFATDIVRSVSAACVLIIVVSYLVLPDKRRHPTVLVLFLGISVFLFSMVAFFSVGNTKALQCASDGIRAADQDNNKLCAAQGAILVFASFASVVWCSILILNLHLHTVWNSTFLVNKYILMNIIGWGVPSAMMGVALGLHAVKFEFANLCLVSIDYIFDIFFYPLAAFVCPAFLIHILTFFYIGKIAIREGVQSEMSQSLSRTSATDEATTRARRHKHVINAFKIQWRALLLSLILVVAVLFYWLFYFTQVRKMSSLVYDESKILDWIGCMLGANGVQNDCVYVLSKSLPPFPLMIVAETLVSTIGTAVFITFAKRSLLREWNDLIYDIRVSLGMRSHVEKNGEQFFAL
ncbi:hypothetical protein BCR43DRAFT_453162 [Syncephalastrum racemosum]|uniref:G-protein coupled receptors family 2 profile 2 domain-containing protein n=1 Tax=Syncephalastrum racemosum TaxID=13706 RepID=A0A1X2HNG9_SYNRA|nr:hypothetical protein BCR43DRAFT_453162 [Syncephalastrum racemosum]